VDGWGRRRKRRKSQLRARGEGKRGRKRLTGQVGVLEKGDEVSLGSLLESHDGAVREKGRNRKREG